MRYLIIFIAMLFFFSCKKDNTIKDAELIGNWRLDSVMYISANTALYKDTIYWGDAPSKRLLMSIKSDNTFTYEYISKDPVGKGAFTITKNKGMKSSAYPTNYPLQTYLVVYYFLQALNNSVSYNITGNQLSVFYAGNSSSVARFTKE